MQGRPPHHQYSPLATDDTSPDEPVYVDASPIIADTIPEAGGTDEHATNPFVASYDVIDFLTTIAFVTTNIAKSLTFFPMISNVLHIINYSLLGYIQAQGMVDLGDQQIMDDESYQREKAELLPPRKGLKSNAEFAWNLAIYILKMMICVFLVALSIISTAVVTGTVATFVNVALMPIAYVLTTGVNALKFGKNLIKGIYDYFSKSEIYGTSVYQINHAILDSIVKGSAVGEDELDKYVNARNTINKAGRDNIQNSIFFGLSAGFLAGSILFLLSSTLLMSAVIPPLGLTIGSALFVASGVLFAAHGISVLANVIRRSRSKPERDTFFGWITGLFYPPATENSILKKFNLTLQQVDESYPNSHEVCLDAMHDEHMKTESFNNEPSQDQFVEKKKIKLYSLYPQTTIGFAGYMFSRVEKSKNVKNDSALAIETDQVEDKITISI